MNTKNNKAKLRAWIGAGSLIRLLLCSVLVAQAQDPGQLKEMFARAQQQNAQALKQYTWKSRNEVRKNGESKSTQVFALRYDALGNLQKSQIGGSAPPAMPKGPILGRIAEKKKEDFIETVNALRAQVEAYSHLTPAKMQAFLASATITARLDQGVVQLHGGNVLQAGDTLTIWLDARTRKQRRVEIATVLERNPVRAVIEFDDLPMGPTYMARTVVDYPKEALQLLTENFDYKTNGGGL
ncbi:MAG: hypothetical protein HYR56_27880 [Acidobacteria bacterium]|nr:hypothetical protein [Acidobacteriota bacterium]MBI3425166.1 hypothetical protein [Acidobacteriota bacterium]